ncbi:MAG: lipase, partial [Pseudomonadota bacterium]|nr:lipase [Pseudomonadota bacterium]
MSITSLQYARLAEDSYIARPTGIRAPGERENVDINGVQFQVLEHVENRRNGYAGTLYQQVDTGEIVVAHRGTNDPVRDGVITDAGMVTTR